MVNQQLLDYIKSVRDKGYSDNKIKEHLIKHNYSEDFINKAFLMLNTKTEKPQEIIQPKEQKKTKKNKKTVLIILIIIAGILLLSGIGYIVFQSTKYVGCDDVSLAVHKIDGGDVLCVFPDNSKIMTIIKNTGQENINNLVFKIKGTTTTKEKLENVNIVPGDISTHTIDYGKSNIKSIEIIPETSKSCKGITYTEIKTC